MTDLDGRTAVLLDQHPLWLQGVERILGSLRIDVVAATTTPTAALAAIKEHEPELLVTEVEMPDGELDGIAFLEEAHAHAPRLKTVVLSGVADGERIAAALEAGAAAYMIKTAHPDDLAVAVRQAFEHSLYLPGSHRLPEARRVREAPEESPGLTRRELEILRLVADGHSNAELARMLWVTEQTIKFHLSNVYRKLSVSNRTEASRWAQIHGLLQDAEERGSGVGRLFQPTVLTSASQAG